jgi:hypothetical protein
LDILKFLDISSDSGQPKRGILILEGGNADFWVGDLSFQQNKEPQNLV